MNEDVLLTAERLSQRLFDTTVDFDQMLCYAMLRKRKEENDMSNIKIGPTETVVLTRFSFARTNTCYTYPGLESVRIKIDKESYFDLQSKTKGVETYDGDIIQYQVDDSISNNVSYKTFSEIEIGDFCIIEFLHMRHLALKVSDNELFVTDVAHLIPFNMCKHPKYEVPDKVYMKFTPKYTTLRLTDSTETNDENNKEGENEATYTTNAKFTFETDKPDELKRIFDHHIDYLLDLDGNRDIVKSVSVSDIRCIKNVADSKGWTIVGIPYNDPEGKPVVYGRFKTTKEKDEYLKNIYKPDSGWMEEEICMLQVINDFNYSLEK